MQILATDGQTRFGYIAVAASEYCVYGLFSGRPRAGSTLSVGRRPAHPSEQLVTRSEADGLGAHCPRESQEMERKQQAPGNHCPPPPSPTRNPTSNRVHQAGSSNSA